MALGIRVVAGCFAMGVTALLLTSTAAQAAPQSGAHLSASVAAARQNTPAGGGPRTPTRKRHCHHTPPPTPAPTSTCKPTKPATPAPSTSTPAPAPQVTVSSSATTAPTGGAGTGGGGSLGGGGNGPLAAGGAAVALVAGGLGLLALRRWRRTRTVA
jgi:hypothetical protein